MLGRDAVATACRTLLPNPNEMMALPGKWDLKEYFHTDWAWNNIFWTRKGFWKAIYHSAWFYPVIIGQDICSLCITFTYFQSVLIELDYVGWVLFPLIWFVSLIIQFQSFAEQRIENPKTSDKLFTKYRKEIVDSMTVAYKGTVVNNTKYPRTPTFLARWSFLNTETLFIRRFYVLGSAKAAPIGCEESVKKVPVIQLKKNSAELSVARRKWNTIFVSYFVSGLQSTPEIEQLARQ